MKKLITLFILATLSLGLRASAISIFNTTQGGTGSSTPSGIMYGDNGATNSLKTLGIGSNLSLSAGVLSVINTLLSYDAWTHPLLGLSATTSQMLFGTSTAGNYGLTIASSSAPQLSLSVGAGTAQWTIRNSGGNFDISTTTVDGTTITPSAALSILGSNGRTIINGNVGVKKTPAINGLDVNGTINSSGGYMLGLATLIGSTGNFYLANGTVTFPSLSAFADSNTGLYFPAAGALGLVTSSDEKIRITSGGNVGVGTTTPQYRLTVASSTALTDGDGVAMWVTRNAGGTLYIATTTAQGLATTSTAAIEIQKQATTTLRNVNGFEFNSGGHGLRIIPGVSTTTLEGF